MAGAKKRATKRAKKSSASTREVIRASATVPAPRGPADRKALSSEALPADSSKISRSPWPTFNPDDTLAQTLLIQQEARRGLPDKLMELAARILERDLHVRSLCQTRTRAIDRVPVNVESFSKSAADRAVAEAVQADIIDQPDFRRLRRALAWSFFTGYEIAEIMWDTTDAARWRPTYKWRPQRFFVWDQKTGDELRMRSDKEPIYGEPLFPYKFICHSPNCKNGLPVRRGLVMPVASYHLIKSFDVRYWISLAEVHGLPWRVGRVQGPEPTEADRNNLLSALEDLGHDAAVLLPQSLELELMNGAQGLAEFHERLVKFCNQEISKGILGQTMTSDDGSSLAQAEVHDRVRDDIRDADLRDLDDTIAEQLIRAYVTLNFGENVPAPYATSVIKKPLDAANVARALKDASAAAGRPMPVAEADALEMLGFRVPEQGERLFDGQIMGPNGPEPDPNAPERDDDEDQGGDGDGDGDQEGDQEDDQEEAA